MNIMTTRHHTTAGAGTERLTVETRGDGTPVVLVHGSLAFGAEEWSAQQPLAERGYELTVYDRRGYGHNAGATGEDFLVDADDIAELLGDGAHLVGHSYGGLGAMIAAARRPDATLSLTLLEAPAGGLALDDGAWAQLETEVRTMWTADLPDREWVVAFLTAVGSNPEEFPEEFLDAAVELTPVFRNGRPFYDAVLPYAELAAATFPKLVVSGGHHAGFEAMCRALARSIDASHTVIEGAGHEIQFVGDPLNDRLFELWQHSRT
jgi:pimeloyl-ACP methyl ester carboxylesterase